MIENTIELSDFFFPVDLHFAALQFSPGELTSKWKAFCCVNR